MKIGISSTGKEISAQIEPRFGRCRFFAVVDTEDMQFAAFENSNADRSGGAGIQSAAFLIGKGVDLVITGRCGPNAMDLFNENGIEVITGEAGSVEAAIQRYKNRQPGARPDSGRKAAEQTSDFPNVQSRCMGGPGRGMGMGGGGGGRGMGGRGMGGGNRR